MRVLVGTSGYSYKEWKGPFYPEDLAAARFLAFYAQHLPTVEINNTFYRMPTAKLLDGWAAEVPDRFTFALKAPQRITHIAKLKDATETTSIFLGLARRMGPRLGPLLFQLPPFLKKDLPRLTDFLDALYALAVPSPSPSPSPSASSPDRVRVALEFRHASWFDDEVFDALRARQASLCVAEGEALASPVVATASWGYVRLRRDAYPDALVAEWAKKIRALPWSEAFVFLKHDDGDAPSVAARLTTELARLGASGASGGEGAPGEAG